MFLWALFIALLCAWGFTVGINYGLPKWISQQNFGLVEGLYRGLNIIAPFFLLYSLTSLQFHFVSIAIGMLLYGMAYGVKQLAWNTAYKDELAVEKEFK